MGVSWGTFKDANASCAKPCLVMEVGGPIKRKTIEHKCVKTLAMFQCTNVKNAIEHNNK
jgi:hypothetical protein